LLEVGQTFGLWGGKYAEDFERVLVQALGPVVIGQPVVSCSFCHLPGEAEVGSTVRVVCVVVGVISVFFVIVVSIPVAACTFSERSDRAS
jgi:hypothetical protein